MERVFTISLFNNVKDIEAKERECSFDVMLDYFSVKYIGQNRIKNRNIINKQNGPAVVCGAFENKLRNSANLLYRSIITYDIDHYKHPLNILTNYLETSLKDYTYIYYTTISNTINNPKMRLFIFPDNLIPGSKYAEVSQKVGKDLLVELYDSKNFIPNDNNSAIDRSSYSPSHLMNLPMKINEEFKLGHNKASLIDLSKYNSENTPTSGIEFVKDYKNTPLKNCDDKKIQQVLDNYDVRETNYDEWFRVCQALHHQYSGSEKGLKIFTDWSLKDDRYDTDKIKQETLYKYKSISSSCTNPITFASIIKIVNEKTRLPADGSSINFSPIQPLSIFKDVNLNKDGIVKKVLSTYQNFEIMCQVYNIKMSFDIITKGIVNSFNEQDQNNLRTIIKSAMILNGMDKNMADSYIHLKSSLNPINSFKNIMDNVTWDGQDRLSAFYNTVGVDEEYKEVRDLYLLKWLQQMLYLTLHEGRRKIARNLLVFQSDQSMGKSTWFMSLLPDHLSDCIGEGLVLDTNNSTNLLKCLKKIFVELGELEQSFKKTDINQFKAFFGRTKDELNLKFVPVPVTYTRTTSFFGTVNEVSFLKDKTGSTRFLILPVKQLDGYHGIDMLQLYRQIMETYGYENFELNKQQQKQQQHINKDFEQPDIIDEQFTSVFETDFQENGEYLSCSEILEHMGYFKRDVKHAIRCDIGNVLRKYDFKYRKNIKKWYVKLKK